MEHLRKPLSVMAMKLFEAAAESCPTDNIIISPFTVTSIVTMLYYASEDTHAGRQIENILKYSEMMDGRADSRAVLMAFREAVRVLTKNSAKEVEEENFSVAHEFRMVLGNRVFLQRDSHINPEFLEMIQKNLRIEFENVNFDEDADAGLTEIERWLKEKIQARFKVSVPSDLVDHEYTGPRMVIASAAHFRAGWEVPFDKALTKRVPFYTMEGKTYDVDMMHLTGKFPYYTEDKIGLKMVELPYFRNEVSLILTLPTSTKPGALDEMTKKLRDSNVYVEMHMQKRMKMVSVAVPKFRFSSTFNIKRLLTLVGIREVFHDDVTLARMTTDEIFRCSEGVHKKRNPSILQNSMRTGRSSRRSRAEWEMRTLQKLQRHLQKRTKFHQREKKDSPAGTEEFVADSPFLPGSPTQSHRTLYFRWQCAAPMIAVPSLKKRKPT
ncbi:putative Heterochromatin-associated protein MENT [Hypsibius exemplaris]|uniref:Heterochromatin-associated protein MENT n=1 Tax=Hypsibius exemplaris TaxID=2072580 RepID=A0A1W0WFZ4_HYPEX|nr:putative Heterochromatin-associated protein MENT [Hypsibius exemplaris]